MQPQPWERRPQPVPAGGGAWSAGEDRLAGAARQPEPWERQQSSVAVYDAVLPSSASWAAAPPGVALPTPPGVNRVDITSADDLDDAAQKAVAALK